MQSSLLPNAGTDSYCLLSTYDDDDDRGGGTRAVRAYLDALDQSIPPGGRAAMRVSQTDPAAH